MSKLIRCWRVRAGAPFGLHVWFDPAVEHVVLLEGPGADLPIGEDTPSIKVDDPGQSMLPWIGDSVSGSEKREAMRSNPEDNRSVLTEDTEIPF